MKLTTYLIMLTLLLNFKPSVANLFQGKEQSGIIWTEQLTWEEVKSKAKKENKFIFIDAHATWCVPCKKMDAEVYSRVRVGQLLNNRFISVKVQIDSSTKDSKEVRRQYKDAKLIREEYDITALPTFLFFAPDGTIVHRDIGFKNENDFISLVKNALSPATQIYRVSNNYSRGKLDSQSMQSMALTARRLNQNGLANSIAQEYMESYLYNLKENELLNNKEHLIFISTFIQTANEKGFKLFYKNGDKVDQILGQKGYAQGVVDYVIMKEEIDPKLFKDNKPVSDNPNWNEIGSIIGRKYGARYAQRILIEGQMKWSRLKNDWTSLARYLIKKIDLLGIDTTGLSPAFLNNMIWEVMFLHINDKEILNKGISWMKTLIEKEPSNSEWLDTYANLLYKVGRTSEAIYWEEKALKFVEEIARKSNTKVNDVYGRTLNKMKQGIPTWPLDN